MKKSQLLLTLLAISTIACASHDGGDELSGVTMSPTGYICYLGETIFNINSDQGCIIQQKARMTKNQLRALRYKNGGVGLSDEQLDKELLKAWRKDHPIICSDFDKLVGASMFIGCMAAVCAYHYYHKTAQSEDAAIAQQ